MKIPTEIRPALYARVSCEQQVRDETIASQLEALSQRIAAEGLALDEACRFVDEGVSGALLVRPALERLRDQAAAGAFDRLYVLCPDRLARSYAHQALLLDELHRAGVEVVFLDHAHDPTPEGALLRQVQGVIAEYERAKIQERNRRGKLHAARAGSISVLGRAPFGYRYIDRRAGGGVARLEVIPEQAEVVRQVFAWVATEGCSLAEVGRRLRARGIVTPTGKGRWLSSTIAAMLANPAYAGTARYGRTRLGPRREQFRRPRPLKVGRVRPPQSIYRTADAEQIAIAVPAIVDEELFEATRTQLAANRRRKRTGVVGATVLLQGLLVCRGAGTPTTAGGRARRASRVPIATTAAAGPSRRGSAARRSARTRTSTCLASMPPSGRTCGRCCWSRSGWPPSIAADGRARRRRTTRRPRRSPGGSRRYVGAWSG